VWRENQEKQQVPPLRYAPVGMTLHWDNGKAGLGYGALTRVDEPLIDQLTDGMQQELVTFLNTRRCFARY
jgi:hypothetical protein